MVDYKPVKIRINAFGLVKVIINVIICYHGLLDFIVSDRGSVFTSKFCSLLCYFFGIKRRLFIAFHPPIND